MSLLTGVTNDKILRFILLPEYFSDIPRSRQVNLRMVWGDGLHRQRVWLLSQTKFDPFSPALVARQVQRRIRSTLQHQRRQHLEVGIERLPVQELGEIRRQSQLTLFICKAWVSSTQQQVCHQAIEHPITTPDNYKCPLLHLLGWHS